MDLTINVNALDEELVANPALVQSANDKYAEAVSVRDAKKEHLDTVEAELDSLVRITLAEVGEKVTEATVKAGIQVHTKRQKAFFEWNEAKLAAAKAYAMVEAVSARSDALKELSKLYVSGYFAIDSTKRTVFTEKIQYDKLRERHAKERLQK